MVTPPGDQSTPVDPRQWRPQEARPTRRPAEITDPILEPCWRGERVIVHFHVETTADGTDTGIVELLDGHGGDVTAEVPRVAETLRGAIMALEAVVDGMLTSQSAAGGESEIAFVALDLLSLDGQPLLDVPLLERRRQLETLFLESPLVRVTPYARPPMRPWFNSWKSAGFDGLVMKAANSRYKPGQLTSDWTIVKRL